MVPYGENRLDDLGEMSFQSALFLPTQAAVAVPIAVDTVHTHFELNSGPVLFKDFHFEFLLRL